MRFCRFSHKGHIHWGLLEGENIKPMSTLPFIETKFNGESIPLKEVKLLAPAEPSKIVCLGLNYADHAREFKLEVPEEPIIFIKPPTTVIGPEEEIIIPRSTKRVDYEAELAIVIGKEAYNVKEEKAFEYIFGYTCANDVTARDLQKKDVQWTRSKSFNTFCPLGPWIETDLDPSNLSIKLLLNGEIKQNSNTSNLIFKIPYIVAFISSIMTLFPGDVILTGTPSGVGPIKPGDIVEVVIDKIGTLKNTVKE
ncbi:fumarylacetoacetate hydrolase family protein [Thermovenabulum gondwanense]|uniref:Ureidoglycolate lyase n=1 Tax=Thermovenabulum gondwanense TaxID=520767 RepID=A0A162MZK7_9FIRM|nr:fumarylacetoacetate hydrolase family protein [Thermovenabulum gondwanense]KYO68602.1 Ureidoglycolate lyase [Thermovenabulum gondwanense]